MLESDAVVTVSPGYAAEIQTKLQNHSVTSLRTLQIQGITNGIDTSVWNPSKDAVLGPSARYGHETVTEGKARAKSSLQACLCNSSFVMEPVCLEGIGIENGCGLSSVWIRWEVGLAEGCGHTLRGNAAKAVQSSISSCPVCVTWMWRSCSGTSPRSHPSKESIMLYTGDGL